MGGLLINQQDSLISTDLISKYLHELDLKEKTKENYERNISYFLDYLDSNEVIQVTKQVILDYKRHLVAKNLSINTINAYLVALKNLYKWLEVNEVSTDLSKHVKLLKNSRNFTKGSLSVNQVVELLNSIDISNLKGLRDYAIILLFVSTALRGFELSNADIEDIKEIKGKSVLFIQGKGRDSKDEFVILERDTFSAITGYLKASGRTLKDTGAIFKGTAKSLNTRLEKGSISRMVKSRMKDIGIDSSYFTCHSLRHSALSIALESGSPLLQVQSLARHSSLNTTSLYLHNLNRLDNGSEQVILGALKGASLNG